MWLSLLSAEARPEHCSHYCLQPVTVHLEAYSSIRQNHGVSIAWSGMALLGHCQHGLKLLLCGPVKPPIIDTKRSPHQRGCHV